MLIATTVDVEDHVYMFYRTVANRRGGDTTPEKLMSNAVVAYAEKLIADMRSEGRKETKRKRK